MIRFKDISIPKPCHEKYDLLPGDEIKRFCGSCEKHVYDFRGKDEAYFNSIVKTHGKVCGVFYEDQIQRTPPKTHHSFYYSFVVKIISMGLFIKTFFSPLEAESAPVDTPKIEMNAADSTFINVVTKNKVNRIRHPYTIDIFINNKLFKSNVIEINQCIYLPDSIKENDKIKVQVKSDKSGKGYNYNIVKNKTYHFKYKEIETITIYVVHKKPIRLIRKRYIVGAMGDFW